MDKKEQKEPEEIREDSEDGAASHVDPREEQIETLKAQVSRALADYANLQKRGEEEKKMYFELATINVLTKFFPILANLEKAAAVSSDPGVGLVLKQFSDLLAAEGLKEIEQMDTFDPEFHEAITSELADEEGVITQVLSKGYALNGKVVQPAKVIVGRKGDAAQT